MIARSYDVVVIGGGIVGAATAYYLRKYGAKTALVERGAFGTEASGRNAGTLNLINDRTIRFDGLPLRVAAIERWRGLSDELGFDLEVNLGKGTLLVAEQESEFQRLRDLQTGHQGQGIAIEWYEDADLRAFAPYLAHHVPAAIYCPIGGLANPRQAGWAYAQAAASHGATLMPQTEVTAIRHTVGGAYAVDTTEGALRAALIVLAAGPWSLPMAQTMGFELPLRIRYFQAAATTRRPAFLLHGLRRVAGMLTLKQVGSGNCVLGGGWTGNSAFPLHGTVSTDALAANCAVAAKLVPAFAELSLLRSWAGYDGSSLDGEPILDQAPGWPGVFVSTGASAGFSYGPVMGELTAQLVLGLPTAWDVEPFALSRFNTLAPVVQPYHA
jgi:glycine/D-amino acid oxidase-like deaminating enzyme